MRTRTPIQVHGRPAALLGRWRRTHGPMTGGGRSGGSRPSRPPTPSGPRLRIRWGPVSAGLAGLLVMAWVMFLSPLVGVREVAVAGVSGEARETVAKIGGQARGAPLVKVDTDRIADDVIALGTVSTVDVERHWPSTLVIRVKPREAIYFMPNPQGGVQVFDAEGVPFWVLDAAPAGVAPVTLAAPDDPAQRRAAAIVVRALSAGQRARVKEVRVESPERIQVNVGDIAVTWGGPERSDVKAKIVDVLARRQGVTSINVVVPEAPVTGGRPTPPAKP